MKKSKKKKKNKTKKNMNIPKIPNGKNKNVSFEDLENFQIFNFQFSIFNFQFSIFNFGVRHQI